MGTAESHGSEARLKMTIRGAVQGVGFRPFVYRLATELELNGWVNNTAHGVFIEVEGPRERLDQFLLRVEREKPAISFIQSLESNFADPVGYANFEIMGREEPSLSFHTRKDGQGFSLSSHNFGFHRRACGCQRLRV